MSHFSVTLPSGLQWVPNFIRNIDQEHCIGCGRCFKTCGQGVLALMGRTDEGELVTLEDEDDDYEKKVMSIAHPERCIGCQSCARNCSKKCISHAPEVC